MALPRWWSCGCRGGKGYFLLQRPTALQVSSGHGEPWALDLDAVAQKISQGEFTAWDIDRLPCRDAEVEPGPGTWFIESPFFPTVDSTGGKVVLPRITWGTHRLFSTAGPSWTLEIGERESVLMPGVPP